MQRLHPQIHFLEMDIRAMTFAPHTFDIVIDKATLDAMLYGSLWDPEDEVRENVGRYVDEVGFPLFFQTQISESFELTLHLSNRS